MNSVSLVGRLTNDPQIRVSHDDKSTVVARFILAVQRPYKSKGQRQRTSDFIPVTCFSHSATYAEKYMKKGMRVSVEGRIQFSQYTNKDGEAVKAFEVIGDQLEILENRHTDQDPETSPSFVEIPEGGQYDEEVPFN